MKITSKRHPDRKQQSLWTYTDDSDLLEKMVAVGISTSFLTTDPWPETVEEVYRELLDLLEDMPE